MNNNNNSQNNGCLEASTEPVTATIATNGVRANSQSHLQGGNEDPTIMSIVTLNGEATAIRIDNDLYETQQTRPEMSQQQENNTRIMMEDNSNISENTNATGRHSIYSGGGSMQQNIFSLLGLQTSHSGVSSTQQQSLYSGPQQQQQQNAFNVTRIEGGVSGTEEGSANRGFQHGNRNNESTPTHTHGGQDRPRHLRTWRVNLNNVFSSPSTERLRSFIAHSGRFRYMPLGASESLSNASDNIHLILNQEQNSSGASEMPRELRINNRLGRSNSLREDSMNTNENGNVNASPSGEITGGSLPTTPLQMPPMEDLTTHNRVSNNNSNTPSRRSGGATTRNVPAPQGDFDDDNNVISEMLIKILSHFVRYLPFMCILFVKFIHDHIFEILELFLLHGTMFQMNRSLRKQVAKFSQKSYGILLRNLGIVTFIIYYRFQLSTTSPDPFGLLINPPPPHPSQTSASESENIEESINITASISLGELIYYTAVNDLILKLITILIKISITMMPTRIIRHKSRARMYVLIENLSQFYRCLAPIHQWLIFLTASYFGWEVFSGFLFSAFYMGAKGFEFIERGKNLIKSLVNFYRNMDYERKPTKDELEAAGTVCPICHDVYNNPVALECSHIFCDDCVQTWFKREQTCPLCRAKVSEDPTWQDGSTSFFLQVC